MFAAAGLDFLDVCGLRVDGRKPNESRRVSSKYGAIPKSDGSVFWEQGNTHVIASVFGPRPCTYRSQEKSSSARVQVSFSISPFARSERKERSRSDRQSLELSHALEQTLSQIILTDAYPKTEIAVFVHVLQDDGGIRSASFNAACMALVDAGIAMNDCPAASSAGTVGNNILCDLNSVESSLCDGEITAVLMPRTNEIVHLHADPKLVTEKFSSVLEAALVGCKNNHETIKADLQHEVETRVKCRGLEVI